MWIITPDDDNYESNYPGAADMVPLCFFNFSFFFLKILVINQIIDQNNTYMLKLMKLKFHGP